MQEVKNKNEVKEEEILELAEMYRQISWYLLQGCY